MILIGVRSLNRRRKGVSLVAFLAAVWAVSLVAVPAVLVGWSPALLILALVVALYLLMLYLSFRLTRPPRR